MRARIEILSKPAASFAHKGTDVEFITLQSVKFL